MIRRTHNRDELRALLERDRPWSLYALGDLAPGFFEHTEWLLAEGPAPALALLYRAFGTPILFTLGAPEGVALLLEEIHDPRLFLSVRPDVLPVLKQRREVRDEASMWRMILDPARFAPVPEPDAVRLRSSDLAAHRRRSAAGALVNDPLDFFDPGMADRGVFFGVYEGDDLVAMAGTHVVAPEEGVAAIGSVSTREDHRNRGLATQVTGAVTRELLQMGIGMVGLNVNQHNPAAIRVYERLGFVRYCAFHEGLAVLAEEPARAEPQ